MSKLSSPSRSKKEEKKEEEKKLSFKEAYMVLNKIYLFFN